MNWSDKKLKEYSEEHIFYEVQMLIKTRDHFPIAAKAGWIQKMTAIESFVIHLRCLITFLYPTSKRFDRDVRAEDFFSDPSGWNDTKPELPLSLKKARERANREVGHLTEDRKGIGDPEKEWPINQLADEIIPILKFFCSSADGNKLSEKVMTLLN